MSAGAQSKHQSAPPLRNDYQQAVALMKEMGSKRGFDPIPPDQHAWAMGAEQSPLIRLWGWMCSKTIHWGHRSPYAVSKAADELHLEHAAADLDMDEANVRRAWREGVQRGLWRNGTKTEGPRKLYLRGHVVAEKSEEEGEEKAKEKVCTDLLPPYILNKIKEWPTERQQAFWAERQMLVEVRNTVLAELVAAGRVVINRHDDTQLSAWGLARLRQEHADTTTAADVAEAKRDRMQAILPQVDRFVQTVSDFVQAQSVTPYNPESTLYPPKSAGTPLLCSDAIEHKPESEPLALGEGGSQSPKLSKNPSVEKKRGTPAPPAPIHSQSDDDANLDAIRKVLENAWGAPLQAEDTVPAELLASTRKLGLPVRALVLWIGDWADKKRAAGYAVESPRLFVHSIERDLPVWARANHLVVERGIREEEQAESRARHDRIGQLFGSVDGLLRGPMQGYGELSVESEFDLAKIAQLHDTLHGADVMGFHVYVLAKLKDLDRPALAKLLPRPPGADGPRWIGVLLEWAREFSRRHR